MTVPAQNLIFNQVKAGLSNVNKDEVTQKISEISKNTKMFARQKERTKVLDSQIDELKYKLQFATKSQLQDSLNEVNAYISTIEKKRTLDQVIFHADLDAFFASVEMLLDPSLRGVPFAVGGSVKHGVVSTSSYEARQFGVRSGMAMFIALSLCPELRIVHCHFDQYVEYSQKVQNIFSEYDSNYTSFGLDEAALNMTEYLQKTGREAFEVAEEMKEKIFNETQLTISIGISPNYQLSKIASDINKPNGIFEVPRSIDEMLQFIRELPVRKIPGIGGVGERKLQELNFETMGDVMDRKAEVWFLFHNAFRKFLISSCVGVSYTPKMSEDRKSLGKEETFEDTDNIVLLMEKIERISEKIGFKLQRSRMACKTVTVKFKTHTFINITRSYTFDQHTSKIADICGAALAILLEEHRSQYLKLRLIGVRVSNLLMPGEKRQLTIRDWIKNKSFGTKEKISSPIIQNASNESSIQINQSFLDSTEDDSLDWEEDNSFNQYAVMNYQNSENAADVDKASNHFEIGNETSNQTEIDQTPNRFQNEASSQFENETSHQTEIDKSSNHFQNENETSDQLQIENESNNSNDINDNENKNEIIINRDEIQNEIVADDFVFSEMSNQTLELKGKSDLSQFLNSQKIEPPIFKQNQSNLSVSFDDNQDYFVNQYASDVENNSDDYDEDEIREQKREDDLFLTNKDKPKLIIPEFHEPFQVQEKKKDKTMIDNYFDLSQNEKTPLKTVNFTWEKKRKTVAGTLAIGSFFGRSNGIPKDLKSKTKRKVKSD